MLCDHGYTEVKEIQKWELKASGKYFLTRNGTSIIAFTVPSEWDKDFFGFKIVGTHTDSPNLRLNPCSKMESNTVQKTCVSTYGGGLWHTWFDRDLRLAGRVMFQKECDGKMKYDQCLFDSVRPLCKVPTLAIHLCNGEERKAFAPSKENHLRPIMSSNVYTQLTGVEAPEKEEGI